MKEIVFRGFSPYAQDPVYAVQLRVLILNIYSLFTNRDALRALLFDICQRTGVSENFLASRTMVAPLCLRLVIIAIIGPPMMQLTCTDSRSGA